MRKGGAECGQLTHIDSSGRVQMVDVGAKSPTRRTAVADGLLRMEPATLEAILAGQVEKGEALAVARVAAIEGAKRTASMIPLCHTIPIDRIEVEIDPRPSLPGLRMRVTVSAWWRTGVEMEAMTGVALGLLALYDMCKALDRGMALGPVCLLEKHGGRSGSWTASDDGCPRVEG